jgi:signal transduction histidine kinase/ActR/RegA family two-component response regulator/HAMP domain-containing protein
MAGLAKMPLDRKLILAMMLTAAFALSLAGAIFIGYEIYNYRRGAIQHINALAGVTAGNSAGALAFEDPIDARQTLSALRADRDVQAAALFRNDGTLLAAYPVDRSAALPSRPEPADVRFSGQSLESFTRVEVGSTPLGSLYLRMDVSALQTTLAVSIAAALAILGLAFAAALAIARRLRRYITSPILELSRTARDISEGNDYTLRAQPAVQPELRVLTDAFNRMLGRIEEGQRSLRAQLSRLDLLHRTTRAIGDRQDLTSILQIIVGRLESELSVDFACVARYDAAGAALVVESLGPAAAGLVSRGGVQLRERLEFEPAAAARLSERVFYEPELGLVDEGMLRRFARAGIAALALAPLNGRDELWGVLLVGRTSPHSFASADIEFLRQLSEHASLAVRQVRLTADLQRAYDDLRQSQLVVAQQERLRALGQMASGIAHDINNAVSPVALYVDSLLEREAGVTERGRRQLETIRKACENVTLTVRRMREFYRREDRPGDFAAVDASAVCREVIELTRARWASDSEATGTEISVREEFATQPVWVRAVPGELRDALVNLVFNAVDAMPQGGVLTIGTAAPVAGEELTCIAVTDTGIGMDMATRARCLEPFFTTKGERGTGMGLTMVYGMVERHDGRLEIESAPDRGTTVRLLLPRAAVGDAAARSSPAPAPVRALRIVVVDDDPLLIQSLRDALELEGHAVTTADGGQAGIDAFMLCRSRGERVDVVVTDLGMPHLDGRAVAAAIKAVDASVGVILLTGWGARLAAEGEVPEGVDRVLGKPPRLADLRAALAAFGSAEERG